MEVATSVAIDVLRLTLLPSVGPVLIGRLLKTFGSVEAIWGASRADLERVPGIGSNKSTQIVSGKKEADDRAGREVELAVKLGVRIIALSDPSYPPLLRSLHDAPPLLYIKGNLQPFGVDRFSVGIVGSRRCSSYGLEQAARFAGVLGQAGLTIVSGGARGIDSSAHRGAMRSGGRTIAVLGCGLAECYPPENADLFEEIGQHGAVVSELSLETGPMAENFPARNRLISGLSLGVVVIEASERSGALITARLAGEDHGREVMAIPGRVDSVFSAGTHQLLKSGGAQLVTMPGDVIHVLEQAGFHQHNGTHYARYPAVEQYPVVEPKLDGARDGANSQHDFPAQGLFAGGKSKKELMTPDLTRVDLTNAGLIGNTPRRAVQQVVPQVEAHVGPHAQANPSPKTNAESQMSGLGASTQYISSDVSKSVMACLSQAGKALSIEEIAQATGLELSQIRACVTMMEIQRRVAREGSRLRKV